MNIRKLFAILLCMVIVFSFAGCGAASMDNAGSDRAPESVYDSYDSETGLTVKEDASTGTSLPENRKLIQTVRMSVETEDLDGLLSQINTRITELAGYVESSNIYNGSTYSSVRYRDAEITVRIPAENLDTFVNQVSAVSNIVSSNKTVDDVTLNYVATESRMTALQTEEARLLELLAKAETMDDLLTIESRLTDVRTELEQVASALRVYDNQVDYATIHLNISEVKEYTVTVEPETVWERIGAGFMDSLKDVGDGFVEFFVFIAVNIPYFILLAVVIVVIILLIRLGKKKAHKKRMQAQAAWQRSAQPQQANQNPAPETENKPE